MFRCRAVRFSTPVAIIDQQEMARHRTTLYLHTDVDVEESIENVNSKELTLQFDQATREDRHIMPHPGFKYIRSMRIHSITKPSEGSIFNYYYQPGTSIYIYPKNLDGASKQEFFDEASEFASQLGLSVDHEWILSTNSFYFYLPKVDMDATTKYLSSLVGNFLEPWSNLDLYFTDNEVTIKTLKDAHGGAKFRKSSDNQEIGVFKVEPGISTYDDLALTGFRVVFNDDDEKNVHKTLFHIKPRHRQLSTAQHFVSVEPNGLHPLLQSTLNNIPEVASDEDVERCGLYGYLSLHKSLFVDKNNLSPGVSVALNFGPTNLELPEYEIREWGNELLFKIDNKTGVTFDLHSRYQLPAYQLKTKVEISAPRLFLACDVKDANLLSASPFDNKLPLGGHYERFFTNDTVYYHIPMDKTTVSVEIPNANIGNMYVVIIATLLALGVGLIWVLRKLLSAASSIASVVDPLKKDE